MPTFATTIPTTAGWYEAVMESQAAGTFEYVYFQPGYDHVVVTGRGPRPLVEVAGWRERLPDMDEMFDELEGVKGRLLE